MAGIDVGSGGKQREVNQEVNMIPFIDMLLVTIAFLLITAVWVTFSRMEARASVPGMERGPDMPVTEKTLHLFVTDDAFVVSWKQGSTTMSETRLPRIATSPGAEPRYDDLAALVTREWKRNGGHQDPSDHHQDLCVLHTDNDMPFSEMVAVMDAVHDAKREMVMAGNERRKVSAFGIALASR
jgi:biopolymer transport protein ExbD